MIMDAQNLFSNAQTTTTGTDTGLVSTNEIDLGVERRLGTGQPVYVVVVVTTAFTSTGSNDPLAVDLISDSALPMDGSSTARQRIGTLPAVAAVGSRVVAAINPAILTERYIALRYTSTGDGALTAGAVTAFLTSDVDAHATYPDNITVN